MEKKYNIYVLLTKTPLKTGKFIRKMTNFEYNHCSISFDKNFRTLYSFSRKYKNASLYSGLVTESSLRYTTENEDTKVQIFKIPLTKKAYLKIKKYLNKLRSNEEDYIYNYFSFIAYPFHKKIKVKKAYTCCEFTVHILKDFCKMTHIGKNGYCSIKELSKNLEDYLIYEGPFYVDNTSWDEDKYLEKQNFFYKIYKTIELFINLIGRFFKGLIIK